MSKKTTSPESGENVKLLGHESDDLNLPPPPEEKLEVSIYDSNNIKQLVNEFKGLHVQRLTCLELDTTLNKEERQQKKVNFLWSYVNDLVEQNQVLAETVEDLQKEADNKVSCRGMKLHASDPILNVSEADLRTLFLDELVGPTANIPHSSVSLVQITSELEDLKKDMVIWDLERTLGENSQPKQKTAAQTLESRERLELLQSELSCLQRIHKDNMKEITERGCITKLQAASELLRRREGDDTRTQLNERARELQEELRRKEEEWRQRENEQKLKYEKEHEEAEERGRQERQRREEEWVRKVDEERTTHAQAVGQLAKKADVLKSELKETLIGKANLRCESQLVLTNVNRWISEQRASNESLSAQMKAQNKMLLILTEEKAHLQGANDTLKAEVKRLKEAADKKRRDMERFQARIRDQGIRQDDRTLEKQGCVARNLSKMEDMQTRLRSNLEAVGMLNQQLTSLSRENKRLRRQLEEEKSKRRQVALPPPPPSQQSSSVHLPPPPPPLGLDTVTGDIDGIVTQTKARESR
ncbi:trichohyalin-like [Pseudochaenichthys georgianus]|uniref:trichohyalin-like n=1 Tax=Pseudochaenichthys georgianus TaxID=52239 RepID=UPI00146BC87E|nr:trichohyalin-like [Pseudochaenichthys georgianus]